MKINNVEVTPYVVGGQRIGSIEMGDGFIDKLRAPSQLKEFVSNRSRLEHGTRVIVNNPRLDEREVTLTFVIYADTRAHFETVRSLFVNWMYAGGVTIEVPLQSVVTLYQYKNGSDYVYVEKPNDLTAEGDNVYSKSGNSYVVIGTITSRSTTSMSVRGLTSSTIKTYTVTGVTEQSTDFANKYHLVYTGQGATYGEDLTHTECKYTLRFREPDPSVRV